MQAAGRLGHIVAALTAVQAPLMAAVARRVSPPRMILLAPAAAQRRLLSSCEGTAGAARLQGLPLRLAAAPAVQVAAQLAQPCPCPTRSRRAGGWAAASTASPSPSAARSCSTRRPRQALAARRHHTGGNQAASALDTALEVLQRTMLSHLAATHRRPSRRRTLPSQQCATGPPVRPAVACTGSQAAPLRRLQAGRLGAARGAAAMHGRKMPSAPILLQAVPLHMRALVLQGQALVLAPPQLHWRCGRDPRGEACLLLSRRAKATAAAPSHLKLQALRLPRGMPAMGDLASMHLPLLVTAAPALARWTP